MRQTSKNRKHAGALIQGVVYRKSSGVYSVHVDGRIVSCSVASRLRKNPDAITVNKNHAHTQKRITRIKEDSDPLTIGDRVEFIDARDGTGVIVSVLPRRNRLSRRSAVPMPTARPHEQVIVANVDRAIPVTSAARPAPKWNLLDRYLVTAEAAGIPAVICINKIDLEPEGAGFSETVEEYRALGYPVFLTSTVTGVGLGEFRNALQGRFSVFLGKSGVGKTSLINALLGLHRRVAVVNRKTGKGRHTTTSLEMVPLECGGFVADTPGTREFGLWDVHRENLADCFPEMRPYLGQCRFRLDCLHIDEPGCAVRQAVISGQISPRRYRSYQRLLEECPR